MDYRELESQLNFQSSLLKLMAGAAEDSAAHEGDVIDHSCAVAMRAGAEKLNELSSYLG